MEKLLRVGVITSPHGVRGEVKVFPTTDDAKRFKKLKHVILDTGKEQLPLEIEGVKFFKNMVILKFEGYDDINAVQAWRQKFKGYDNINDIERYRQKDLLIKREQAVALKKDEYFIPDLIGLQAVDESGTLVGTVKDVLETGANDVYQVTDQDGKNYLLPSIPEVVIARDIQAGVMKIRPMRGIFDED